VPFAVAHSFPLFGFNFIATPITSDESGGEWIIIRIKRVDRRKPRARSLNEEGIRERKST
jgi:hypothetical protein